MPEPVLRCIGWYAGHPIRIWHDGEFWTVTFESIIALEIGEGSAIDVPWIDSAKYRTLDAAQSAALGQAQKKLTDNHYRVPLEEKIQWRSLSD